ncbi:hypothetical protein ACTJNK_01550 [Achromobacter anxifer]|uniref:Type VI secretion system protein n=1 Tax=Achromobacter anxifer TaxID=1287737 RepID=A0A6S7DPX3_9BURK|nr:hypothetical protein [Achromobacter anxifer]CAB3872406.1 hypothetical protein LMG26858_02798 [Achromobacter anxifer]CAB5511576.1 hypothetical protein LMG26857_00864 [Achromobacter anxifer]
MKATGWARRAGLGGALILLAALAGCSALGLDYFKGEKPAWKQVVVSAADDANGDSPVAVDLVLVKDETLLARFAELTAAKWFAGRADLLNTYPQGLRYEGWEVVPGQHLTVPGEKLEGPRVAGAFVFARYAAPGAHRARVDAFSGRLLIRLENKGFTVTASQ